MKIISWNVNGLRNVMRKNGLQPIFDLNPDIICLQETRCPSNIVIENIPSKYKYSLIIESKKPGYSGVGIISTICPTRIIDNTLDEGRCICAEYDTFFLINLYVPNSKKDLSNLPYRTNVWQPQLTKFIQSLVKKKEVILCGDFNVAPYDIDVYIKKNNNTNGATMTERNDFIKFLNNLSLIDTFRNLNPNKKQWTWYSNFGNARKKGNGWRIDFFLTSKTIFKNIIYSSIIDHDPTCMPSDHVPIYLELKI